MVCKVNEDQLVDFYFGNLNLESRGEIEKHLIICNDCLHLFLTIKRDIDLGKLTQLSPSTRIKEKVFSEFSEMKTEKMTLKKSWARPVLIAGFAAAAIILLMVFLRTPFLLLPRPSVQDTQIVEENVDSGGRIPNHLNIL